MKLVVKRDFHDINKYSVVYTVGQEIDIEDIDRVSNLIERGLCAPAEEREDTEEDKKADTPEVKKDTPEVAEGEQENKKEVKRGRKPSK